MVETQSRSRVRWAPGNALAFCCDYQYLTITLLVAIQATAFELFIWQRHDRVQQLMTDPPFVPWQHARYSAEQMQSRALEFYELMNHRRSVREFSGESVPRELIELAIQTASTAPSGAHRQPWTFVAISDPMLKREIRLAVEKEERISYEGGRMSPEWKQALEPLGTDWQKPYLETAPWIVVAFEQIHGVGSDAEPIKNYYVKESVGIACGLFVSALHYMGLATLTHTPSPMGFLSLILERPDHERPYILFPVGYPAVDAVVPNIRRKELGEVAVWKSPPT